MMVIIFMLIKLSLSDLWILLWLSESVKKYNILKVYIWQRNQTTYFCSGQKKKNTPLAQFGNTINLDLRVWCLNTDWCEAMVSIWLLVFSPLSHYLSWHQAGSSIPFDIPTAWHSEWHRMGSGFNANIERMLQRFAKSASYFSRQRAT